MIQLAPPGTGGVRDYLECLQNQWCSTGIKSQVLAMSQNDARHKSLATRLEESVGAGGQACSLVLHFSGYGFERRGMCFWLVREIEQARAQLGANLRLVTMFHELFASGPPWGSAFWLSRFQASIAARLARASDGVWTNTELHGHWLRKQVGAEVPIRIQPVLSTIGEPPAVPDAGERELRLIVFGAQSTRHRALARLPRHAATLRCHGITQVLEIGTGAAYPWREDPLRIRFLGRLDKADLRSMLGSSAYGLIDYPSHCLTKSSVYAAYAAHGCVTLNTADPARETDGLQSGLHYVTLDPSRDLPRDVGTRQAAADAARSWYAKHSLARQAQTFAELCGISSAAASSLPTCQAPTRASPDGPV